jgi:hypothetical protein
MNSLRSNVKTTKRLPSDPESDNAKSQNGSSHVVSNLTKTESQMGTFSKQNFYEFFNSSSFSG